jgi:hypothetical protein
MHKTNLLVPAARFLRPGFVYPNFGVAERRDNVRVLRHPRSVHCGTPRARVRRPRLSETPASRRSTVAILGSGPRFSHRGPPQAFTWAGAGSDTASSSRPGRSARKAGCRASRGDGCEPAPRDATPRSAFRYASRTRPE